MHSSMLARQIGASGPSSRACGWGDGWGISCSSVVKLGLQDFQAVLTALADCSWHLVLWSQSARWHPCMAFSLVARASQGTLDCESTT